MQLTDTDNSQYKTSGNRFLSTHLTIFCLPVDASEGVTDGFQVTADLSEIKGI